MRPETGSAGARVLGVVGGSGGVGASVLSCAVAVRAAQAGRAVLLLDGCRFGGGLDVLMGVEQERGLRWPDLAGVRGAVDGVELLGRLPSAERVSVLAFDRSGDVDLDPGPVHEVVTAARSVTDLVVIDLPPPGDRLFDPLASAADAVLLLCGRGVGELAAASAKAPLLAAACADVRIAVRTAGRGLEFADEVSDALELPLVGGVRDDPALSADLLHGIPPGARRRGPLVALADRILLDLLVGARAVGA